MRYIVIMLILLITSPVMAFYDRPYIEYDDDGITQINCIRCNIPVLERILLPREKQYVYRRLSHLEVIAFDLNNGSYTEFYFCRDCKREYQRTEEELAGMTAQFKLGFELEAKAAKKSDKHIKKVKKRYEKMKVEKGHIHKGRKNK